jgi:NTP pyrophosphatase (non-canonical NTP hydrolase)
MDFKEYQEKAKETAIFPDESRVIYPLLGLAGETGEVVEKLKRYLRESKSIHAIPEEDKEGIKKELGDVLWYLATLAEDLDLSLEEIAKMNIEKLASRKERGLLHDKGDNR